MKPKKYLALLLSLCLFCSMTAQATVVEVEARSGEEKVFISSLNQEQYIEQLSELGVGSCHSSRVERYRF